MESQHQESAPNNSFLPEDTKPVLPADLLNLNDAEMAKLYEPGQPNAVLLESYSYQDMQDIVSSNPDLITESFETLIQELDELSQPESSPPVIGKEKEMDSSIFFLDGTKLGTRLLNIREETIHTQSIVSTSSQNLLSAGMPCSFPDQILASTEMGTSMPPQNCSVTSMQDCSNNEAAFSSLLSNEGNVKCKTEVNSNTVKIEEIERRIDSTVICHAGWSMIPVCFDQTVSSSKTHTSCTQSEDKGNNSEVVKYNDSTYVEKGQILQSIQDFTSSSISPNQLKHSTLDLKSPTKESLSRKLSCDSSSTLENTFGIQEQILNVVESIIGKVEAIIESPSFISSSCKIKLEVDSDCSETLTGSHKCHICGKVFIMLTNYSYHQSSHTKMQVFCCNSCDLVFESDAELMGHNVQLHNYSNGYLCKFCSTTFPTYCEYEEHCACHSEQKPFKCGECDFKFMKFSDYCLHLSKHTGELIFKCIVCTSLFRSKDDLFSHQRFFHSPDVLINEKIVIKEDQYRCETCGKLFKKLRAMLMHKTVVHKTHKARLKDKSKLCCGTCMKSFVSVKKLRDHTAAAHQRKPQLKKTSKISIFKCGDCEKTFHSNAVYSRHMLTHQTKARRSSLRAKFQIKVSSSSFREMKFLCEFCCDPFRRAFDLKKHIEAVHTPENETIGKKCQPKTKRISLGSQSVSTPVFAQIKQDLEESTPDGQKFQVIQESNEVWININNNMLRGIKAEGPHPKQLEDASKLIRQNCVRNSPNDESVLYFCTQCSLSFKTIFELIQHKQLHPLPFLCPTCGLSFLIENDLLNHICSI